MSEADDFAPAPAQGLLDLSRQQRNLLLLRPLFQLELNKTRIGDDSSEDRGVLQGVDTHYLVLCVLDLMMEATTISMGCTQQEILDHLAGIAGRMKPALSTEQQARVAEVVLDALDNKANTYKEFAFEHFDALKGANRTVRFRLVVYEPDFEDIYRYRPTAEGYLVYLGMLDLSPEDTQEMMEKMLDLLVQRGRFEAALEIAKRARTLSIEYRQLIRDRLHQAYRAPGSVNWTRDMSASLNEARDHVRQRQSEDQRMEASVSDALRDADEPTSRSSLAKLLAALQGAGLLRSLLVNDIGAANERFLESQRSMFRARRATGLPDLESRLFPQLLALSCEVLADEADDVTSALYPAAWPRVYDLNTLFSLMLEQRPDETGPDADDGEITRFEQPELQFSEAAINSVSQWLAAKFATGETYRVDQLLDLAEDEGLDRATRRCLVLVLFRSYSNTETEFKNMRADALGNFSADVAQGTNLQFTPKGEQI
jgi:hypothetical protein